MWNGLIWQGKVQVAGVVNTVVELQAPSNCGSVLTSLGTVSLTRRNLLHVYS